MEHSESTVNVHKCRDQCRQPRRLIASRPAHDIPENDQIRIRHRAERHAAGVAIDQPTGRNADNAYSYGGYDGVDEHAVAAGPSRREAKNTGHVATGPSMT